MSVQTASYIEAIEHLPKGATLRVSTPTSFAPVEWHEQPLAESPMTTASHRGAFIIAPSRRSA